jgi:PAS domain S-box-containing protein
MRKKLAMKKNIGKEDKKQKKSSEKKSISDKNIKIRKKSKEEIISGNAFFESSITANCTSDINSIVNYANPEFLKMWGYTTKEEVIGKPLSVFFRNEQILDLIIKSLNDSGKWKGSYIAIKQDGSSFISECSASLIINEKDEPTGYQFSNIDITTHKKIDDNLHKSEERFRKIFDEGPLGMVFVNESFKFIKVNPAFCKMTGYSEEELLNLTFKDITHPDFIKENIKGIKKLYRGEISVFKTEKIYVKKNKEFFWGSLTVTEVLNKVGDFLHYFSMVENISERKNAEIALQNSEKKYRKLLESILDGFALTDMNGKILEYNKAYRKMLGYNREELSRLTYLDITPEKWYDFEKKIIDEQIIPRGYSDIYEKEYIRKDGTIFPIELRTFLLKNENGENEAMGAIIRDITVRKLAEEEIKREKNITQNYLDIAEVILLVIDENMNVTLINKKGCGILGYSENEIKGKNWFDNFIPEEDRNRIKDSFGKIMSGEIDKYENNENKILTKSREERIISWHNTIVKDDTGKIKGTLSSGFDITERKRAEEELAETRSHLENIINHTNVSIIVWNMDYKITRVNYAFEHLTGYKTTEVIGMELRLLFPKKTGNKSIKEISGTPVTSRNKHVEIPIRCKNGVEKIVLWNFATIYSKDGKDIIAIVAQGQDIKE